MHLRALRRTTSVTAVVLSGNMAVILSHCGRCQRDESLTLPFSHPACPPCSPGTELCLAKSSRKLAPTAGKNFKKIKKINRQ